VTQFSIGDRVRLSPQADPERRARLLTEHSMATFIVTLPGPHSEEWTAEALQQDIAETYGLREKDVVVTRLGRSGSAPVDVVAAAIYDVRDDTDMGTWDELGGSDRERYECDARAAISALDGALHSSTIRAVTPPPISSAAPPSVADMAPGTTFVARTKWGHEWPFVADGGNAIRATVRGYRDGISLHDYDIHSSTIRDVTPPEVPSTTPKEPK
jgi:hypothetical protein